MKKIRLFVCLFASGSKEHRFKNSLIVTNDGWNLVYACTNPKSLGFDGFGFDDTNFGFGLRRWLNFISNNIFLQYSTKYQISLAITTMYSITFEDPHIGKNIKVDPMGRWHVPLISVCCHVTECNVLSNLWSGWHSTKCITWL